MGLEIGKRGLAAHQKALYVTGHNISNADNKEYSRQRAVITSAEPLYVPALNRAHAAGNLGQGAVVAAIERIRDTFIDDRIIAEKSSVGYWNIKNDMIYQVERVYNEPSDQSVRRRMDQLWTAWQELSKYPEERSAREVVKERGIALANEINTVYRQLHDIRENVNRQIQQEVTQVNLYAKEIRDLNVRIAKAEALGDNPNDLLDKRDALIEKLSSIVNITVRRSNERELIVYIAGENLVQGEVFRPLEAVKDKNNTGFYKVLWKDSQAHTDILNGSLAGLLEMRDVILRQNINDINSLAINLIDMTNEVHRNGFGRNGETNFDFFRHIAASDNPQGNFDLNNDGIEEVTAIFRVAGNNKIDASAPIGVSGTLTFAKSDEIEMQVLIDYHQKDSVKSVMKKINDSQAGIVAYLNQDNRLVLKATASHDDDSKNFMMRHVEDSGQFLVGITGILKDSGSQGAFNYRRTNDIAKFLPNGNNITLTPKLDPAATIAVTDAIQNNIDRIAAGQGKDVGGTGHPNFANGIGDGTNALAIAELRHKYGMIDRNVTFNDFYVSLISRIGAQGQEAKESVSNKELLMLNLVNIRESISGVNLDEEMANMIAFQHGYNAAARLINTMDQMLDTIINRMGR